MKTYIDKLEEVATTDVAELKRKDAEYGSSWKKRGGPGAYMVFVRKIDRLETQLEKQGYDIFKAALNDDRPEGILDDIRDARRYLCLIEAEILTQRDALLESAKPQAAPPVKLYPSKISNF